MTMSERLRQLFIIVLLSWCSCAFLSSCTYVKGRNYQEHMDKGDAASDSKSYLEAEKEYKEAIRIARGNAHSINEVNARRKLAQMLVSADRESEAEPVFKQNIERGERVFEAKPALLASTYDDLAIFYLLRKRFEDAKPLYERSISLVQDSGTNSEDVNLRLELYTKLLTFMGREADAEQLRTSIESR